PRKSEFRPEQSTRHDLRSRCAARLRQTRLQLGDVGGCATSAAIRRGGERWLFPSVVRQSDSDRQPTCRSRGLFPLLRDIAIRLEAARGRQTVVWLVRCLAGEIRSDAESRDIRDEVRQAEGDL